MTKSAQRARFATAIYFFVHGLIVSTWFSRIPAVQTQLHLSPAELGLALLGTAAGALISMPITGALVTRLGSRPISIGSTILMCVSLTLLPHAPNQWFLTFALAIYGVFSGAMNVSMNSQAVVVEQVYGRAIMSSFHALFSLGGMTGSALGGLAAGRGISPQTHFVISAVLFIAAAVAAGGLMMTGDKGRPGQPVFAKLSRPMIGLGCLAFCVLLNEGAMADWSSVYLRRSLGTGEGVAATGYAVFSFAMAFGRLLGDWMTERFGRVNIVRVGGTLAALGLGIALVVGTVPATLAGFIATGAGFSVIVPLTFGAAGRNGESAGVGLAAVNTAGYLGFLSGPAIIGFAAELSSLRAALGIVVLLSIFVALLARTVSIPAGAKVISAREPVLQ